jgi:hypothetical protein
VPDASLTTGSRCGDGTCDRATAETASSCPGDCGQQCVPGDPRGCLALPWPAGVAGGSWKCDANGLCQARASRFVCGDGACSPDLGESAASCPADCGTTFRCSQAEDCLAAAWPDGAAGGRWACTGGQCAAVPGSGACGSPCSYAAGLPVGCPCCGDGRCDLAQGEGPGSCPADCQGGGCASAAECAALPWSDAREGHWACASDRTCVAVFDTALDASKRECGGTDGACHFHGQWERRPDVP